MIEEDEGLQNLLLDDEITVTLRMRDWITIAIIWTANGGVANYTEAVNKLETCNLEKCKPTFDPCMSSCYLGNHENNNSPCKQERVNIEKALFPFIGLD